MQELLERLELDGLTPNKAEATLQVISDWLQEHYPVAGVLVNGWLKNEADRQLHS